MIVETTTETGLAAEDQHWLDAYGAELPLGAYVRVATALVSPATGYPSQYPNQRPIDYGRVYALLDDGTIKVQWFRNDEFEEEEPVLENPACVELTTRELTDVFRAGCEQGYEEGFRDGGRAQMNTSRIALGMQPLNGDRYTSLILRGE